MSIRKRGRYYLVDVGRGSQRVRRSARTRQEAYRLESELRQELVGPPSRGLEEALAEYLRSHVDRLSDVKSAESKARLLRPYLTGKTLDDAPEAAQELRRDALKAGLKPATVNRRLALLRRLCNLAHEWGWTDKSIGRRIKMVPGEDERHVYLSHEQVEGLAALMPRTGDFVRLVAYTGLRRNEAMKLTQENVHGHTLILRTLKNRKPRMVPVPARIQHLLPRLPWSFTDQILRDEWERARVEFGMPGLRVHDLRHSYASFLAAMGLSDREMAELLGHMSPSMVKRYAHLRREHLQQRVAGL